MPSRSDYGHNHDTGPAWEHNFTLAYAAFMQSLTEWHASPGLPIFCASGPLTTKPAPAIQAAVDAHNAAGGRAVFLDLNIGHGARGCYGHPSAADHAEVEALAAPVIAKELGW